MRSWKIGTAFGIGIYVHWTFVLLPAWIFVSNLTNSTVELAVYLVALTLSLFGCVVLHELGHALMARRFGIPTRDITLYPIGGVARLERMSERPWEEFWIAIAGPTVNILIAIILGSLVAFSGILPAQEFNLDVVEFTGLGGFLVHLLTLNVFLAGFNLLPAFPMDGGRIFRALLAAYFGQLRATQIAARVGAMMSLLFLIVGAVTGGLGLIVLAVFVYFVGQQELFTVTMREARRAEEPLDVVAVDEERVDMPMDAQHENYSGFTWDGKARLWVEWRNGRPIHTISVDSY